MQNNSPTFEVHESRTPKDRSIINCLIPGVAYASSLRFFPRKLEAYATYLSNAPTRAIFDANHLKVLDGFSTLKTRSSRGFVLLMVLVAIIVVGVAMTASARRSLLASVSAIESQQSIQRRWGSYSCQLTLLAAAPSLFEFTERSTRQGRGKAKALPAILEDRIILGDQVFDLLVADEDAKANLNAIYDMGGLQAVEKAVSDLAGTFESRTSRLTPVRASASTLTAKKSGNQKSKLSGNADSSNSATDVAEEAPKTNNSFPAFRSWGEVFDLVQVSQIAGEDRQVAKMTRNLTLFGTGQLNVFRAADETVLAVCQSAVTKGLGNRVLSAIRETSIRETDLLLERTVQNEDDRQKLRVLLGSNSRSFSIWIETSTKNSRQQRFAVQSPNNFGNIQIIEFSFE